MKTLSRLFKAVLMIPTFIWYFLGSLCLLAAGFLSAYGPAIMYFTVCWHRTEEIWHIYREMARQYLIISIIGALCVIGCVATVNVDRSDLRWCVIALCLAIYIANFLWYDRTEIWRRRAFDQELTP